MLACDHVGQLAAVAGHAQPIGHLMQQRNAARLMAVMARQQIAGRRSLAEVVAQAGVAHRQRRAQPRAGVEHEQQVCAGVDLRMVLFRLRHAPQSIDLGQQPRQGATVAQHLQHARRRRLHQTAGKLLPHAFGHQCIDLARGHHLPAQRHRFRRHLEIGQAGGEARQPQDAHRVLGKGLADVAQHAVLQVTLAAEGVDDAALCILGHRVDRQVAARQVLLQRHRRVGVEAEAVIARRRLALGARQRVFLLGLRMQEHGEVAAHRPVTGVQHLLRRRTDYHPVMVAHRPAEQAVTHATSDGKDLHAASVGGGWGRAPGSEGAPRPRGGRENFTPLQRHPGAGPPRRFNICRRSS